MKKTITTILIAAGVSWSALPVLAAEVIGTADLMPEATVTIEVDDTNFVHTTRTFRYYPDPDTYRPQDPDWSEYQNPGEWASLIPPIVIVPGANRVA